MLDQRGIATVTSLVAMVFLGIIIAGLMMLVTSDARMGVINKNLIEAQFAAEAGAKRALVMFQQTNQNWAWLDQGARPFNDEENKTYQVTIDPQPDAPAQAGTYIITSIGNVNGATKEVRTQWIITNSGSGNNDDPLFEGLDDPRYNNTTKWAALSNADMIAYNGNQVINNSNPGYLLGTTASNSGFQWGLPVTTSVQNVFLDLLDTSFFNPNNPRFSAFTRKTMDAAINPNIIYGSSWGNLWGPITLPSGKSMFEVQGNVAINTPLAVGANDRILIYSHGNININYPLQGNFAFVAEGTINLNAHSQHNGQQEFYSIGNIEVSPSVSGYGVFMTRGALHVTSSYYVKAFMYGRNNVIVDVNGQITGAIYSNGSIRMNSNTVLTYDPSAIPRQ